MVTRGEGKKMLQTFQRKTERRMLQVVWSNRQTDESSNKKEYQSKGTRGSGWQSEVEMGRPCGKNGPAQMDRHCINVGRTDRQRRNGRPKTLWADTFKRAAGWQWSRTNKNWWDWLSSPIDKTLELCLVPQAGRSLLRISSAYLFIYTPVTI